MKKESKILIKGMVVSGLLLFLVFSISADTWVLKTDMPTARTFLYPAAAVVNGKVYVIGGYTSSWTGINEEYDPVTNTWTSKESMPTARGQMAVCVVDGKIYCIGGEGSGARQKNEVYDPVTNSWDTKTDIPTSTIRPAYGVVDGKIYVIGGTSYGDTNWIYDPLSDSWSAGTNMPTERHGAGCAVYNGKIYVIGGHSWSDRAMHTETEVYDPQTDSWETKTPMPTARTEMGVGILDGRYMYLFGGLDPASLDTNEMYDLETDTWSVKASMTAGPRRSLTGVSANGKIYAIGGHYGSNLQRNEEYTDETGIESPSFYARVGDYCIHLHWSINMEDNCLLYLILKKSSKKNSDYYQIARIPGTGSSPSPNSYSYKDEDVEVGIRYYYKLGVVKTNGNTQWYGPVSATVIGEKPLLSISPNPFTEKTVMEFKCSGVQGFNSQLPNSSTPQLRIYDMAGREVKHFSLLPCNFSLTTTVVWDGRDNFGKLLPSGIYYCRLIQGSLTETRKILFVK